MSTCNFDSINGSIPLDMTFDDASVIHCNGDLLLTDEHDIIHKLAYCTVYGDLTLDIHKYMSIDFMSLDVKGDLYIRANGNNLDFDVGSIKVKGDIIFCDIDSFKFSCVKLVALDKVIFKSIKDFIFMQEPEMLAKSISYQNVNSVHHFVPDPFESENLMVKTSMFT